jgi:plastocyanin
MRAALALAALVAVAAAPAAGAKRHHHAKPHAARRHAPPTPRIRAGIAAPLTIAPATDPVTGPDAPTAPPITVVTTPIATVLPHAVGVSAKEFSLSLTRTLVGAGSVTIELRNTGEDGHDLHVDALDGTPVAAWDELPAEAGAVSKVVTLAAGTYRLYCSLPGHAASGMDTRLNVAAG